MRIVQITTDSREHFKDYDQPEPYFGTAPQGLIDGFKLLPEVELHVISCSHVSTRSPVKLAENVWFHQPVIGKWGWGRSLFSGCVMSVRGLVHEIMPDIVHGQGTERDCALAAVLSGKPNVITIHGNMRVHAKRPENSRQFYHKIASALETFCLARTDGVVAISRYTEDLVKGLAAHTWLLPNAVDPRFYDIHPEPQAVPRILFVGSLDERKNPLALLRACEPMLRSGECTLTMAGQYNPNLPYVQEVLAVAANMPGVEMLGFIGRDKLAALFQCSSLLVLPTFEDNCPMVVLEAMAAGLPVAASRVGGVPDLISHDLNGLMFDPHDPSDMISCLENLVRDPTTRARLATQARITADKRFHPRIIASEHLHIYREVLELSQ